METEDEEGKYTCLRSFITSANLLLSYPGEFLETLQVEKARQNKNKNLPKQRKEHIQTCYRKSLEKVILDEA